MSLAHVTALVGVLVAALGVVLDVSWVWAPGAATTVWYLVVAGADDEAARGFLAFLSVPVILTVAVLTSP